MKRILWIVFLVGIQHLYAQEKEPVHDVGVITIQAAEYDGDLKKYLAQNTCYPASAVKSKTQGRVYVSFFVETDGRLTEVTLKKGIQPEMDQAALSVVKNMPKWKPAIDLYTEKPIRQRYVLPVTFKITTEKGMEVFTPKACK